MDSHSLPLLRRTDLSVDELDDETLVYDHRAKKALCLNRASSMIWKMCDGATPISVLTRRVQSTVGEPIDESFVSDALQQLDKHGLLEACSGSGDRRPTVTRQEVIRRAGVAVAFGIPLVSCVMAPTPAKAYGTKCDDDDDEGDRDRNDDDSDRDRNDESSLRAKKT